jgi:hypothetical protein
MKNIFIFLFITFFTMTSCKTGVEITFINESNENFKSLRVDAGGKDTIFENLESGKSTKPYIVKSSYSYCQAKVITENDTLYFIPFDFIGEKLYKSGKLKLKLKIRKDKIGKKHLDFVE